MLIEERLNNIMLVEVTEQQYSEAYWLCETSVVTSDAHHTYWVCSNTGELIAVSDRGYLPIGDRKIHYYLPKTD